MRKEVFPLPSDGMVPALARKVSYRKGAPLPANVVSLPPVLKISSSCAPRTGLAFALKVTRARCGNDASHSVSSCPFLANLRTVRHRPRKVNLLRGLRLPSFAHLLELSQGSLLPRAPLSVAILLLSAWQIVIVAFGIAVALTPLASLATRFQSPWAWWVAGVPGRRLSSQGPAFVGPAFLSLQPVLQLTAARI